MYIIDAKRQFTINEKAYVTTFNFIGIVNQLHVSFKMNMQRFGMFYLFLMVNFASAFMNAGNTGQNRMSETVLVRGTGRTQLQISEKKNCYKSFALLARLSDKRKKELGVADDEDEYDLSQALNANTDPLITKLIAGSLIIVMIGLLTVAVIIPLTSETVDGLCNPILNAGRC